MGERGTLSCRRKALAPAQTPAIVNATHACICVQFSGRKKLVPAGGGRPRLCRCRSEFRRTDRGLEWCDADGTPLQAHLQKLSRDANRFSQPTKSRKQTIDSKQMHKLDSLASPAAASSSARSASASSRLRACGKRVITTPRPQRQRDTNTCSSSMLLFTNAWRMRANSACICFCWPSSLFSSACKNAGELDARQAAAPYAPAAAPAASFSR